jgi:hypothetical protein
MSLILDDIDVGRSHDLLVAAAAYAAVVVVYFLSASLIV